MGVKYTVVCVYNHNNVSLIPDVKKLHKLSWGKKELNNSLVT